MFVIDKSDFTRWEISLPDIAIALKDLNFKQKNPTSFEVGL